MSGFAAASRKSGSSRLSALLLSDFGDRLVPYEVGLNLQKSLRAALSDPAAPDILLQLQHPPVYSIGKRGVPQDFLVSQDLLRSRGIDICEVQRGGETTFHGPGQIVLYPVVNLRRLRKGARAYVEGLEDTIIETLQFYNIKGEGRQPAGRTGVWVEDRKIAALGVQISGGIAIHGIALNVMTDLQYFKHIVPCGLRDSAVTSLEKETGKAIRLKEASNILRQKFQEVFGYKEVKHLSAEALVGSDCISEILLNPTDA